MADRIEFVLGFDQAAAGLESVGGKGLNLIRLAQAGMPVPPGFIVSTNAYQAFVEANHLAELIRGLLPAAPDERLIEDASRKIRAAFENGELPPDLASSITFAYRALCARAGKPDLPVAVRSSATAEDLAEASFAGQQDTYLNVNGETALLDAIRRCFGSLWSPRAIAYRARQGLAPLSARLAVVIQEMVFAEAAGVVFTANPLSGDHNDLVIDAAWGLGEALVSGLVTPDHMLVDKRTCTVRSLAVADKTMMIVPAAHGTQERPVPRARRRARVLSNAQIRELTELAKRIESYYGRPQDLEWGLAGGRLYILQARPITTLPNTPVSWDAPGDGQWLHGGGTFEMITEPISPLFETFLLPIFAQAIIRLVESFGLKDVLPEVPYKVVNGYIYLHMNLRLRPWHLAGVLRDFATHMDSLRDQQSEQDIYRRTVQSLSQPPAEQLTGMAILDRLNALGQAGMRYWLQIMKIVQVIYRQERRFVNYYHRRVRREGDADPEIFLRGQKILPWEAECSAFELAQLALRLEGVAEGLAASPEHILTALAGSEPGRQFLKALEEHTQRFGHQLASFDLRLPTLADDPRPVLSEVQAFLEGKESPVTRQQRMQQEREQAVERVVGRLSPRRQRWFHQILADAQGAACTRENALFEVGLAWVDMHRCALELGRRFVRASALQAPDDIFWLHLDEVRSIVAALDASQAAAPMHQTVGERQRLAGLWSQVEPPYLLPVGSRPAFWWGWVFPVPELQNHPDPHTLIGLGVSPGKVTAIARVITRLEEMDQLKTGEILVAHTTTPAWTPLFAKVSGLVTDLGGPLAHGSIVAREYGIPAVMGTGNATRKIHSGQTITIYGSEGKVSLQ